MSDAAGPPDPDGREWVPNITGYRVLEEIGRGGFALVYRAEQLALHRTVAVKVVSGLDVDRSRLRRFERECAAIGSLSSHPHVVSVYDAGTTNEGLPFLSMEYLPAGSLADRLRATGPLPYDDVIEIGVQLSGALEAAHQSDVLHRDIKPENILVGAQDQVKLADFGIAFVADATSHTATGTMVGTVKHSAPEVLGGARATVSSDVYSLGSTMFALLTGNAPFWRASDESAMPAMLRATRDPLPDLREHGVPDELASLVEKACAKNARDRFPSAAAFGQALQSIQPKLGDHITPMQTSEMVALLAAVPSPPASAVGASPPPPTAPPSGDGAPPVDDVALAATAVSPPLPAPSPEAVAPTDAAPTDARPADARPADAAPADPISDVAAPADPGADPAPVSQAPTAVGAPAHAAPTAAANDTLARPLPGTVRGDTSPPAPAGRRSGSSDGPPRWILAAGVALLVVLVAVAVFFIRRGDNSRLATDGRSDRSSTTATSEPAGTSSTATSSSAPSTTAEATPTSTSSTTTPTTAAPPPPNSDQEVAEATSVAESQYPGFRVTDTGGWRGKTGVSSVIVTDDQGREKIVVFIDGVHVGNDYPSSPSHNVTMLNVDANGFTVAYDLFNAGEDDNCCAPIGQHVTRFDRAGDRLKPSNKSAPYDRNVQGHR